MQSVRAAQPPSEPLISGETPLELDSVEGLEGFKYAVTVVILLITIVSALFPLWVSRNGTSAARQVLMKKLPFLTAGVFIGSGLMHLLPDSVKTYEKVLRSPSEAFSAKWIQEFPLMYLLSALGCMLVWAVDLVNLGDSPKMMAVASAARPNYETSIYRVQVPRVASFGLRSRSMSADAYYKQCQQRLTSSCACDESTLRKTSFHHATTSEETHFLLNNSAVKLYTDSHHDPSDNKHHSHHLQGIKHGHAHPPPVRENDAAYYDKDVVIVDEPEDVPAEATVSEHVTFSGESPLLPYLLAALFSIHSLIAGFALGVNRSSNKTAIATAVAIFSHKVIEAISVGANFARAKDSIAPMRSIAVLTLYSFMTPVGIVMGMVLSSELQGTSVLIAESFALSFASGSFVYLAFHEMSDEHGAQDTAPLEKIVLFGAGLLSMAALATWA